MSGRDTARVREAQPGAWVEIATTLLEPGARAPQVPPDTQQVALEMRVKGFALHAGRVGDTMGVTTPAGRTVSGVLLEIEPAYTHGFGTPVPELLGIGRELRALLAGDEPADG